MRYFSRLSLLPWLVVCFSFLANAQGIHVSLRAQANPFNGYQNYASVWGDGHYAYVGSERRNGVLIFDVANPDAPVLVSQYAPSNSFDMEDVKVANGIGYFADNFGSGLHIVDLSDPTNPQLISQITSANGGYDKTHKIAVWNNFVFIPQNLTPPAIIKVFDVSNPAIPVLKTTFTATDPQWINDVTIQDNGAGSVRLYAAGWSGKCDIWDVTNIATQQPTLLGSFSAGVNGSSSSATADGKFLAYSRKTTDGTSEVKIYNITNPASVTVASTITMSAFGIDAVAPHDPKIMGNLLYVSWFQAGTLIFDISNPFSPVFVGSYDTYPGAVTAGQLDGNWGVYPYLGQDRVLLSDRNTGLYIVDATGVSSQAALYNFKLNPTSVVGPNPSTGTVYLVGIAPGGGAVASLTSDNSIAVVPPTVTVPAGSTSGAFTVTTSGVATSTTANLTATYSGTTLSSTLTITPDVPSTLKFNPAPIVGGLSTTGTVTMAIPAPTDTTVALAVTHGSTAVSSIPSSVTVLAGTSTATFTMVTNPVTSSVTVTVSATANGGSTSTSVSVLPNTPASLTFSPSSVPGGASSTGTVTLAANAASALSVALSVTSGSSAVGSIPASVTVAAGSKTATFTLTTVPVAATTSVVVSATANGTSKTGTLTVTPVIPTSLAFNPASVVGGGSSTGTVTLNAAPVSDTSVALAVTSGSAAVQSLPSSVTALAGATTATFTLVTNSVASTTIVGVSATANGTTVNGTLTVTPGSGPASVTFNPASVVGGASSTGTVTMSSNVSADTVVTLAVTSGGSAVKTIPASVTVLSGTSSANFTVATNVVATATSVVVSATTTVGSASGTLTVTPNVVPSSLAFVPASVFGGGSSTGTVTLAAAPPNNASVTLTVTAGSSAVASIPVSVTVLAGQTTGSFTLTTNPVSSATTVSVSATLNGGSAAGNLAVNPNVPTSFSFNPSAVVGGASSTGTVTLSGIAPVNTTVTLAVTSGNSAVASIPASVTVPAGSSSTTFNLVTNTVTATTSVVVSATANGGSKNATLTVTSAVTLSAFKFSPGTVIGGLSSTGTVTLSGAAPVDTVVLLAVKSGGSAVKSIPSSVTVLAGSTSGTFTLVTNEVTAITNVSVAANVNGTTKTAGLTVTGNVPTAFFLTPANVVGGGSSTGKVTFGIPVTSDTTLTLQILSGASAIASMPSSVVVPQGASSITWTIMTNPVAVSTPVQIKASANGGSSQATLTVNPNSPTQVTFTPSSVVGGASSVGKVTFTRALLSDTVVTLSIVSGNSAIASMPSSITVPAGSTSGTWTVLTAPVQATTTVQISATANGGSKTGSLTVKVGTPGSLIFSPTSVTGGSTATGMINFIQPVAVDTDVQIAVISGAAAVGSYPSFVTVPAGTTSTTFTVLTNPVGQSAIAQFSATANLGTTMGNLTVK